MHIWDVLLEASRKDHSSTEDDTKGEAWPGGKFIEKQLATGHTESLGDRMVLRKRLSGGELSDAERMAIQNTVAHQ